MRQPIPIDTALWVFAALVAVLGVLGYYLYRERRKVANAASEKLLLLAGKVQAEQAMEESEARFELTANAAPILMWRSRADGEIDWFNSRWLELRGRSLEQEQAGGWLEGVFAADRERAVEIFEQALAARQPFVRELRLQTADGRHRWLLDQGVPRHLPDGRFAGFIGTAVDVDQRKRQERMFAALFECTSLPGLEFYGQLACTLAGAFEMHHAILALLEPDQEPALRTLATWSDGKRGENYRYPVAGTPCAEVVAGGTFFCPRDAAALYPADLRLARLGIESYLGKPLLSPTGKVVGIVALLHDQPLERPGELEAVLEVFAGRAAARLESERLLLEAQTARAEAEAASRAKDVFLATVSHELRNPLNTIVSWAHLLRVGNLDAAEVALGLDTIERGARTQAQLIEELLDLSRVVSGTMRLERRWIRPLEIIESAIAAIAPAAMAKRITVERHLGPVRPLEADPVRLQQAVFNLLANAVKFTPEGGRVAVRSQQSGGEISIEVDDSGAGIEPELLPWVFDRFRQGAPTVSERRKGLGLGLTIVRHITELHGGTVTAASDGKGRGATFTLRLPTERRPDLDATGALAAEPALVGALAGLRVLVVEDDPEALDALSQLLRSYGAEVEGAGSASQALETFTAFRPAVLVSDIELPGPSGDELLVHLRSLPPGAGGQIPAVALTAAAGEENRRRILSAGFHTRLTKPVEPYALVTLLADLGRASV